MDDRWHFGFNDNSPLGWLTTGAYFVVAALCGFAARRAQHGTADRARPWLVLALGMVLLGLNKQLDLQNWLRFAGRDLSQHLGLYQYKIAIRSAFLILLAATLLAAVLYWRHHFQAPLLLRKPALLAGLLLLALFILLSALHPSQLERWDALPVTRSEWHWTLEVGGLLLVACSAVTRGLRG